MGQSFRAVEQIVANLENQELISLEQGQRFLGDYGRETVMSKEMEELITKPDLTSFLKYYITCRYPSKKPLNKPQPNPTPSPPLHPLLSNYYTTTTQILTSSLTTLNQTIILGKYSQLGWTLVRLLKDCLTVEGVRVVKQGREGVWVYDGEVDWCGWIDRDRMGWGEYQRMFQGWQEGDIAPRIDTQANTLTVHFPSKTPHILNLTLPPSSSLSPYSTLLSQAPLHSALSSIINQFFLYFTYTLSDSSESALDLERKSAGEMLAGFGGCVVRVVELGVRIREERVKMEIGGMCGLEYQYSDTSLLQFITTNTNPNTSQLLPPQHLPTLHKHHKTLTKTLNLLPHYHTLLSTQTQFLSFTRFSQLQLAYLNPSPRHPLLPRLQSCLLEGRVKIIDVFGDNQELMGLLRDKGSMGIGMGMGEGDGVGIREEVCGGLKVKVFVEKGVFAGLMVQLGESGTQAKANNGSRQGQMGKSISKSKSKSKVKGQMTSMIQQKLVKDLQKSEPDIKTSGWLKLFVKQAQTAHEMPSQKPPQKWSVTDIDRSDSIENPSLNILSVPEPQLQNWTLSILRTNPTFSSLISLPQTSQKFHNFLSQLHRAYNKNGNLYHNFYHGVNVLHMCYVICANGRVGEFLGGVEMLGVFVAGLCHDVGHSGFSNRFQIDSFSQRALIYNDISPLQNYQASKTLKLLTSPQTNFLATLPRQSLLTLTQNIIHNILHTDFTIHFQLLTKFQQWTTLPREQALAQYSTLTAMIVHTADYAGSCKDFGVAREWSARVNGEFVRQWEMERKLGMAKGSQIDFGVRDSLSWVRSTLSYVKFMVLPLYKEIAGFCGGAGLEGLVGNLGVNVGEWEKLISEKEKEKEK